MADIRSSLQAAVAYLSEHPDEARYTDSPATARLEEGLLVRVEGPGDALVVTDMPPSVGGGGAGPSPGWLFRAALASCVATFVAMVAAEEGLMLTGVEVEVDSESDDRGVLGMDASIPAGPLSVRIQVRAEADDGDADGAEALIRRALERCPVYELLGREVPVEVA